MINKISFKNYKLFKEKQTLELKPITILIGKNNSGKSAVLKLMTLIEGALGGKNDNVFELKNDDEKCKFGHIQTNTGQYIEILKKGAN